MQMHEAQSLSAAADAAWEETAIADFSHIQIGDPCVDEIRRVLWKWFDENGEKVVLRKKIIFFSVTVRVRDLRFIFQMIAGPHP
jgi:hypothetical protein